MFAHQCEQGLCLSAAAANSAMDGDSRRAL